MCAFPGFSNLMFLRHLHSKFRCSQTLRRVTTKSSPPLNILVVVGSSRTNRIGGKISQHVANTIESRGHKLTILDPRDDVHDDFFMRLMEKAYFHYKDDEVVPSPLEATAQSVRAADAYVVVSPEYVKVLKIIYC